MKILGMLVTVLTLLYNGIIYPDAMTITDITDDVVTVETATGMQYEFISAEDYTVGDIVAMVMYSNGTDNVEDDTILKVRYSGYWRD